MLACESDSVETVEALLRGGANTQLVDGLGHKATDYSVTTGNQRIIEMLQDGVPSGMRPKSSFSTFAFAFVLRSQKTCLSSAAQIISQITECLGMLKTQLL